MISRFVETIAEVSKYRQRCPSTDRGVHVQTEVSTYRQRCPRTDRGVHVQTEVSMYKQRCPCTDRGVHVQIHYFDFCTMPMFLLRHTQFCAHMMTQIVVVVVVGLQIT